MRRTAPPMRVLVRADGVCGLCEAPLLKGTVEVEFCCGHVVHEICAQTHGGGRFVLCPECGRSHPRLNDASLTPALDALMEQYK